MAGEFELSTDEKIDSMTFTEVGSSVHYQFQNFSLWWDYYLLNNFFDNNSRKYHLLNNFFDNHSRN